MKVVARLGEYLPQVQVKMATNKNQIITLLLFVGFEQVELERLADVVFGV